MSFRIHALPAAEFQLLFEQPDAALAARNIRRVVADHVPGYPCRVSLQDAERGEQLLLLPYAHHPVESPYRASGPIFVRRAARQAMPAPGEVPPLLRSRELSLRAYDRDAMMVGAKAVPGRRVEEGIEALLALPGAHYLHVHYALPGCYACRVTRR